MPEDLYQRAGSLVNHDSHEGPGDMSEGAGLTLRDEI